MPEQVSSGRHKCRANDSLIRSQDAKTNSGLADFNGSNRSPNHFIVRSETAHRAFCKDGSLHNGHVIAVSHESGPPRQAQERELWFRCVACLSVSSHSVRSGGNCDEPKLRLTTALIFGFGNYDIVAVTLPSSGNKALRREYPQHRNQ